MMFVRAKADIRETRGDLPPWTIHTASCDWCERRAVHVADAASDPVISGNSLYIGGMAGVTRELVCAEHVDQRMNALVETHGGASAALIRQSWKTWLFDLPGLWRLERWWNADAYDVIEGDVERLHWGRWGYRVVDFERGVIWTGVAWTRSGAYRKRRRCLT